MGGNGIILLSLKGDIKIDLIMSKL